MGVAYVPASRAHVGRVARRMREIDQMECRAKGREPAFALRYSLASSSFAFTVMIDGSPHAMFGLTPWSLASSIGRPWMLGSDEVQRFPREMVVHGQRVVDYMQRHFRRLENVIAVRNDRGLAMLRKWGFVIGSEIRHEGGEPFVAFWRGQAHV